MTLIIGIMLALVCALATNVGFLYKHRGACQAPAVDYRHPLRSAHSLFSCKAFAGGFAIATGAWAFHVAAMSMAPLTIVQSVLAGGVVLLAIMAERSFGLAMSRRQWAGIALTAVGLLLLGFSLPTIHGAHSRFSVPGLVAFEGALIGVGLLLMMGRRLGLSGSHHGFLLGASAGLMFAASDIAIKAVSGEVGAHGVLGLFSGPLAIAVFCSVAAFYASAKGLQDGDAVPVIAVTGTGANVGGILGGIVVFGEPLSGHPLILAASVFAFVLVLVAAWLTPAPLRVAGAAHAGAVPAPIGAPAVAF
jgi:drug/metabolite transporter (DMT)-like permease